MKLPRGDQIIRSFERMRRGLERTLEARTPRETYTRVLDLGLIHNRDGLSRGLGRAEDAWQLVLIAGLLAQPELLHSARCVVWDHLLDHYPLRPPGGDSARSGTAGEMHLRLTAEALHFHLVWHDLVWTLLVGILEEGIQLPGDLANLDLPSNARMHSLEDLDLESLSRDLTKPVELGDILYRHLLLDRAVPLFATVTRSGYLSECHSSCIKILTDWYQSSPLTRLENLEILGQNAFLEKDSWPGLKELMGHPLLDVPGLISRALCEFDERSDEPLSPGWQEITGEILRATITSVNQPSPAAASLWKGLVRLYSLRGGLRENCQRILSAGAGPGRLGTLMNLANSLMNSPQTTENWSVQDRSALEVVASAGRMPATDRY